jgi:hypothetical protein
VAVSRAGIAEHLVRVWADGAENFPGFMKRGTAEKREILIAVALQQSGQRAAILFVARRNP